MSSFMTAIIMKKKINVYFVQYVEDVLLKTRVLFQSFSTGHLPLFQPHPSSQVADPGEGGPPPLILDQTEAQRAEKKNWRPAPLPNNLGLWMTGTPLISRYGSGTAPNQKHP